MFDLCLPQPMPSKLSSERLWPHHVKKKKNLERQWSVCMCKYRINVCLCVGVGVCACVCVSTKAEAMLINLILSLHP